MKEGGERGREGKRPEEGQREKEKEKKRGDTGRKQKEKDRSEKLVEYLFIWLVCVYC